MKYVFSYALDKCAEDLAFFNQWYDKSAIATLEGIINSDFERLTYAEAVRLLEGSGETFEFPVGWGLDLQVGTRTLSHRKAGGQAGGGYRLPQGY